VRQFVADLFRAEGGVLLRREHPELADTLWRLMVKGEVVAVLPGETAAAFTFWPELVPGVVEVANRRPQFARSGFRFSRRRLPAEQQRTSGVLRMTAPALTALDLIDRHGGDAIDRVLRNRTTNLAARSAALSPVCGALAGLRRSRQPHRVMAMPSGAACCWTPATSRGPAPSGWRTGSSGPPA
jgi:hypothetical protein